MGESEEEPTEKPGNEWTGEWERQIIIQCPACNGTGDGPRITREMALDGGCPELEGTPSFCLRCGGSGVDVDIDHGDPPLNGGSGVAEGELRQRRGRP